MRNRDAIRTINNHVQDMLKRGRKNYGTMYAILWAASEAIGMSGGGNPDDFLMNTPEDKRTSELLVIVQGNLRETARGTK